MKTLIRVLTPLIIVVVMGCPAKPVREQFASPIPNKRIYESYYVGVATSASDATLIFLRDSGFPGSGCAYVMYVNNVKIFAIRAGEKITIHVPAGQHILRMEAFCLQDFAMSLETTLAPGESQTYRAVANFNLVRIE